MINYLFKCWKIRHKSVTICLIFEFCCSIELSFILWLIIHLHQLPLISLYFPPLHQLPSPLSLSLSLSFFSSFSLLSVCFFLLLSTTSHLSPYLLLSFLNICNHLLISTLSPSSLTLWLLCPVHFSLYLSLSLPFTLSKHSYLRHNT